MSKNTRQVQTFFYHHVEEIQLKNFLCEGWSVMRKKPNVVHILANGKRVKSIEGHVVPADNPVYGVMIGSSYQMQEDGAEKGSMAV